MSRAAEDRALPVIAKQGDEDLLRRFASGEDRAVLTVESWVRAFVRYKAWGASLDDQDDIVQMCLLGVWRAIQRDDLRIRGAFCPYVLGVAAHCCLDWLRRQRRERLLEPLEDDAALPDPAADPAERMENERRVRALTDAIERLNPLCQEVLRLRFFAEERLTSEEVGQRLGIRSAATVRWRLADCIRRLRETI
jgi:RNA polymerase sigma-70 factor (ECF subfamily)